MKKGLLILSHDIEDGEALFTRALLVRAGIEMCSITFENTKDIQTAFGLLVKADKFAHEVQLSDYDFVVIPGGKYVHKTIGSDVDIKETVKSFYQENKLVAAICAGPRFLGQAGLLDDVNFTAFKGSEVDMPKGIYHPELKALRDGHIITARGAGAVYEFVYEIVSYLLGEEKAKALLNQILF